MRASSRVKTAVKKRLTDSCIREKAEEEMAAERVVAEEVLLEALVAAAEWPSPPYCALVMLKAKFCSLAPRHEVSAPLHGERIEGVTSYAMEQEGESCASTIPPL